MIWLSQLRDLVLLDRGRAAAVAAEFGTSRGNVSNCLHGRVKNLPLLAFIAKSEGVALTDDQIAEYLASYGSRFGKGTAYRFEGVEVFPDVAPRKSNDPVDTDALYSTGFAAGVKWCAAELVRDGQVGIAADLCTLANLKKKYVLDCDSADLKELRLVVAEMGV